MGSNKAKQGLMKLARKLAINHYNVSIARSNPLTKDIYDISPGLTKIFIKKPTNKELIFSRNILIVGAGASKNSYDFIETVEGIIAKIHKNLNVRELLGIDKGKPTLVWNKYVEVASGISHNIFDDSEATLEDQFQNITRVLNFEGNLELLSHFYRKQDIGKEIQGLIHFKYLPTLSYEIIAHLFKHRYIDIIINLNFDELLDNAIDDEMGATKYHKVIDGENTVPFEQLVDNHRLRIPIYLKIHGSIISRATLKYTNDQYVEMAHELKELMSKIFSGSIGSKSGKITEFNIIFCGYSFNDIDIQHLIFKHLYSSLNDKSINIEYFFFGLSPAEFIKNFIFSFNRWVKNNFKPSLPLLNPLISKIKNTTKIPISSDYEIDELEDVKSLGSNLLSLYNFIRDEIHEPFKPKSLVRHTLLLKLFPRNGIKNDVTLDYARQFFERRAKFYCLFDFVKHRGLIPINLITTDRAAKYYELKNKISSYPQESLIEYLQTLSLGSLSDLEITNHYLKCLSFYNCNLREVNEVNNILYKIAVQMVQYSYIQKPKNHECFEEIKNILWENVFDTKTNEINAVYNDPKHGRFYPFPSNQIIYTNLELTWRFFDFAIKKNEWNTLLVIDDAGKSLFNLYNEASSPKCYLKMIANLNKKIYLIHSIKDGIAEDKKNKNTPTPIVAKIHSRFIAVGKGDNFKAYHKEDNEHTMHRMALYLKKNGKIITPVFGMYFFKPSAKVRINPVYFYKSKQDQNQNKNLNMMLELFKQEARTNPNETWDIINI